MPCAGLGSLQVESLRQRHIPVMVVGRRVYLDMDEQFAECGNAYRL
jgi:hypothetical protein